MSLYNNGGLIGVRNTATNSVASGIWRRNEQLYNKQESNWPAYVEPVAPDPNFSQVKLLAGFNDALTDDSDNAVTLSQTGSGSYSTGQFENSRYMASGANYLLADKDSTFSVTTATTDWTVECWVNITNSTFGNVGMFDWYATSGSGTGGNARVIGFSRKTSPTTGFSMFYYDGATFTTHSDILSFGDWHHVGVCRSGGTIYYFQDGVVSAQSHSTSRTGGTGSNVAIKQTGNNENNYNAYFDEFRVTVGTARYTSTYTVPTAAFPRS